MGKPDCKPDPQKAKIPPADETPGAALSCKICEKPVQLENCKTDEGGGAVHPDCYFGKLSSQRPAFTSQTHG